MLNKLQIDVLIDPYYKIYNTYNMTFSSVLPIPGKNGKNLNYSDSALL